MRTGLSARPRSGSAKPWELRLLLRLELFEQFVDRAVHGLAVDVAITNHAVGVEHVDRRPALHFPRIGNRAPRTAAVPEGTPGDLFLLEHFLQLLAISIAVDADER